MNYYSGKPLDADPLGLADMIEREAQGMDAFQMFRELVINGPEAGATSVLIDGYEHEGRILARVSDNGKGMSEEDLQNHLTTVFRSSKRGQDNIGWGARVASLPRNKAGVTFASRTADETEQMIQLRKATNGTYETRYWDGEDDAGNPIVLSIISPDAGELDKIGDGTGTAVILHGDGKSDTWNTDIAGKVGGFLANRFFQFPEGVTVRKDRSYENADKNRVDIILPFGKRLAAVTTANGSIPFKVAGLTGRILWHIVENKPHQSVYDYRGVPTGVGLLVSNEIFDYERRYMGDFGIVYPSARNKIVILIEVDDAIMDSSRAGLIFPGGRKFFPWKDVGMVFAENMPAKIESLMETITPNGESFAEALSAALDQNWRDYIKPILITATVRTARATDPMSGLFEVLAEKGGGGGGGGSRRHPGPFDGPGPAPQPGDEPEIVDGPDQPPRPQSGEGGSKGGHGAKKHRPVVRGGKREATVEQVNVPRVEFMKEMDPEHPYIWWCAPRNTVFISETFPPYVREIERWMEKSGGLYTRQAVTDAVKLAYSIEYASLILDAKGQTLAKVPQDVIDQMLSDAALYAKAIGCQSLTATIDKRVRQVVKAA